MFTQWVTGLQPAAFATTLTTPHYSTFKNSALRSISANTSTLTSYRLICSRPPFVYLRLCKLVHT